MDFSEVTRNTITVFVGIVAALLIFCITIAAVHSNDNDARVKHQALVSCQAADNVQACIMAVGP